MHRLFLFVEKITKIGFFVVSLFLLLAACSSETSSAEDTNEAERVSYQMNTVVLQYWYGENAEIVCDEIEAALSELEEKTSLFIDDSEINEINAAAGEAYVQVSQEVFDILYETKQLCAESDGSFDITIGPLTLLWDIAGDKPQVPEQEEIVEALAKVDYTKLLLNEEDCSVMLADEGMKIDLGGVVKGYAAKCMEAIAEDYGVSGYLSIGGNTLVVGEKPDGSSFVVGVRDPLEDANSYFATIDISGYTMASSSAEEIYFEEDGVKYHHILDPETGYPGETDILQVSVISENGLLADVLSTTIFLKGSECLEEYMDRDDCMVLAVTEDLEVYASAGIWERLTPVYTETYNFIEP